MRDIRVGALRLAVLRLCYQVFTVGFRERFFSHTLHLHAGHIADIFQLMLPRGLLGARLRNAMLVSDSTRS
jgi:hypothetical protein